MIVFNYLTLTGDMILVQILELNIRTSRFSKNRLSFNVCPLADHMANLHYNIVNKTYWSVKKKF